MQSDFIAVHYPFHSLGTMDISLAMEHRAAKRNFLLQKANSAPPLVYNILDLFMSQ